MSSNMELISSSGGNKCVDESEGITYQFMHILHAASDHGRNIPAGVEILETSEAGFLVCEGCAHPCLHVAHMKLDHLLTFCIWPSVFTLLLLRLFSAIFSY